MAQRELLPSVVMSSKAFFQKSTAAPRRFHRLTIGPAAVEVWTTTCIVTNFGRNRAETNCSDDEDGSQNTFRHVLLNPSNPELSGCANFPYFPRGGPVPARSVKTMHADWQPLGFVSQWGGMDVGHGMLYAASVIDGLVHQTGGWKLRAECKLKRVLARGGTPPCPVGTAVKTSSGGEPLNTYYDAVVHTTPPFYRHDTGVEQKLAHCYQSALGMAFSRSAAEPAAVRAAVPLLGSGARGFPFDLAIHIAAEQSIEWLLRKRQDDNSHQQQLQTVAFGLLEQEHAEQLSEALQRDWNNSVAQKRDGERRR